MKTLFLYFIFLLHLPSAISQTVDQIKEIITTHDTMWINSWEKNPLLTLRKKSKAQLKPLYEYSYDENAIFQPFNIFSPSGTFFADIYSRRLSIDIEGKDTTIYYGDPDSEIVLFDIKKKKQTRLFYSGSGVDYENLIWLSDSSFIVLMTIYGKDMEKIPFVYACDLKELEYSSYGSSANILKYDYIEAKFKAMKIINK